MTQLHTGRDRLRGWLAVVSVWILLAAAPLAATMTGAHVALVLGFGGAASVALAYWVSAGLAANLCVIGVGVLLGSALFPVLCVAVGSAGVILDLDPIAANKPFRGSPASWLAAVAMAPIFEELLYRHLLLQLLRVRVGLLAACAVSVALFAAAHVSPWGIVSGVVVGCFLTGVSIATKRLDLCVGLHAGMNLGSLCIGTPPPRWTMAASVIVAAGLIALAAVSTRFRGLASGGEAVVEAPRSPSNHHLARAGGGMDPS